MVSVNDIVACPLHWLFGFCLLFPHCSRPKDLDQSKSGLGELNDMMTSTWPLLSSFQFRKAKRSGSNIFALFSQKQIQEFKEAFGIMDTDKDGIISASDLKAAFSNVGKSITDSDASSMLAEAPGPVNFTQLVTLFAEKMAGGKYLSLDSDTH